MSSRVGLLPAAATSRRKKQKFRLRIWQRLTLTLFSTLLAAQQQVWGAASTKAGTPIAPPAPTSPPATPPYEIWTQVTILFQRLGGVGIIVLGTLAILGYVLSQAQNWEAMMRILRRKQHDSSPSIQTEGNTSPVITGGAFSSQGDLVIGGKHEHHSYVLPPKPRLPSAHTPHNLSPFTTRPPAFIGREEELETLTRLLQPPSSRVLITGMGGVGKSELALQHANRQIENYRGGIVRLDARQGFERMAAEIISFVRSHFPGVVPLPGESESLPLEELLGLCWNFWPHEMDPPEPVLLILDDQVGNAEGHDNEARLCRGLPPRFRRIITQREASPPGVPALALTLLNRPTSRALLRLQVGPIRLEQLDADPKTTEGLCEEVGDLPLALILLGACLAEEPYLRPSQLLMDLKASGIEARALQRAHPELGANRGLAEALLISWATLSQPARELAMLLALMAPAAIPWSLVEDSWRERQQHDLNKALGGVQAELRKAQFLQWLGAELVTIHPLVHGFLIYQSRQHSDLVRLWQRSMAAAVTHICRSRIAQASSPLQKQKQELAPFIPHIEHVGSTFLPILQDDQILAIYNGLVDHSLTCEGDFKSALHWLKLSLNQCKERFGSDHSETAFALDNLANLLVAYGRPGEAEPLARMALSIFEESDDTDHPNIASLLITLARSHIASKNLTEAETLSRRALEIDEATCGAGHSSVARDLSCLGRLMTASGNLTEAESLLRRALSINEANYGKEHPSVAGDLRHLGRLMLEFKRFDEAEVLLRRSLELHESIFGIDHPVIARSLADLAELMRISDRSSEAESLLQRGLRVSFLPAVERTTPLSIFKDIMCTYVALIQGQGLPDEAVHERLVAILTPLITDLRGSSLLSDQSGSQGHH